MKYYAIHCQNALDAIKLCQYLKEAGVSWLSGEPLVPTCEGSFWSRTDACYCREHEDFVPDGTKRYLCIGGIEACRAVGYEIVEFFDDKSIIDYIIDPPEKMKFNIKAYPGRYAMHCPTEESAKIFTAYLHSLGKKWSNGTSYLEDTCWISHAEDTCYSFNTNQFASLGYMKGVDYKILEFCDFDWDMEIPYEVSNITLDEILGLGAAT